MTTGKRDSDWALEPGGADLTLSQLPFGIAVFDRQATLVFANTAFRSLLDLASDVVPLGMSLTAVLTTMIERGEFCGHVGENLARQRMHQVMAGNGTTCERARPGGRWIEERLVPKSDGGSIHVYCDITDKVERRWRAEGLIVDLKARVRALEEALLVREARAWPSIAVDAVDAAAETGQ